MSGHPIRRRALLAGAAMLALAAGPLAGTPAAAEPVGTVLSVPGAAAVPGSYVVVLKPGAAVDTAAALSARHGGEVRSVWRHALRGYALRADAATAAKVAGDPRVAFVQQDVEVRATAVQTPVPSWGLDRIDQRRLPLNNEYHYDTTASTVTAFVIDTGIRTTHTDFGTRASWGTNTTGDGINTDCNGHGTHVAGTIGGTAYGVAKRVRLVAVKVLGCAGSGTTAGVIAGVDWVTANSPGPSVANMSLGGGAQPALDAAVSGSIASGVPYAVGAGGSASNACNFSPARVPTALTVGSVDRTDTRSSSSNYGTCLDLFAPGVGITSAWNTSNTATAVLTGTSMASPHVAGVAALKLAVDPTLTSAQVHAAVIASATPNVVINPGLGSPNRLLYSR